MAEREVPRLGELVGLPEPGVCGSRPTCGRLGEPLPEAGERVERPAELLGGRRRLVAQLVRGKQRALRLVLPQQPKRRGVVRAAPFRLAELPLSRRVVRVDVRRDEEAEVELG
jgi:hypothetical protein